MPETLRRRLSEKGIFIASFNFLLSKSPYSNSTLALASLVGFAKIKLTEPAVAFAPYRVP
jgi:hypothetical protein